ncbi:hypothetical protein RUM43_001144 [Polyplax serrata]|uniref:Uncharacterized protein n=1 Tax=Polyplax serrata TaxID=468196 RepID=A0AAN8SFS7_POLSC
MSGTVLFSPSFRATAPRPGVWSPNQKVSVESTEAKEENQERKKLEDEPIPPVWTPRSAQASPVPEKKEFRPVNFESPVLSRKKYTQEVKRESSVPPPWQQPGGDKLPELAKSPSSPALSLPRAPNPTVTLLQKAREGYLPRGARYLNSKVNDTRSPDDTVIERLEFVSSTSSKTESERPRDGEVTPKKVVGIGPTSKEGIPLVLRSEVNAENKEKWYKRMYDSLHKAGSDDDYVTVKYRTSPNRRGVYGYQHGSTSGYQSEPETLNSDLTSKNYITLDRRREETVAPEPIIIKTRVSPPRREYFPGYKNQPGKIEDYEPGRSSISEVEANKQLHYFSASGYISDPQFVYKRTEDDVQSPPSSEEQKEAYKIIQKGGEIPLKGLRKPAPERPKDDIDTEIEYFPLSSTLTRIRVHKQNITPLCDFPFSLNPSVHQETTLSFPDLSYGVCSSYAQIQLFSPCGQHELNQDLGEFSNSPVVEIHPRERDKKFSVHLQNISEPNNYVPVVPKPRIKQRKPPIYVNLPVSGKSDSSDLSIPKEEESQIGIFQVPSGLSRNVSSQSSLKKQGFATFSELKRIAPSLLTKRTRSVAPPKTVIKIAKAENTSRKSSIPVSLSSLRDKKSILSGKSKETLISRREIGLEKPKKEKRETSQSRIADQEPKRLKKETKKCKLTHSESFQRVKPPSKTNRSLKTLTINVNRNKAVIKSLSKEKKNKEEENRDKENKRKRTDSDSKAGNSDIPALQSSASNLKSSPSGSKKAQSNAPTEATGSKMSSAYDNSEQASMPRIDDNVTEAYRNRSFSPDVRRKIFKLPDMNKPLPPKRKQSKYSPTLRILSKMKVIYPRHRSRLDEYESNVKFLQDKIKRKLKDEKETKIEFGDVETVRTVKKDKSGEMSIKTNRFVRVSRPLSSESLRATYPDIGHRGHIAESRTRYGSLDGIKTLVSGKSIVGSDVKNTSEIVVRRSVSPLHKRKTIEIKESSRKGTIAALPPKKSSSPNPSLSSLRSGISMKSPVSDKGSTSSTERIRSPHTKLISPNSSVSRLSSVSRSISPVTPVIKTRSQKTVDSRLSAKKSTIVPIQQKSVIAKRAVKQREVAPVVKKCAGQRILLSKIEKTAIAKAESAKKVTQVGKTVVSGKEKLRRDKIGTVLTVIKKDPVEETGQEKNEITAGRDLVRTDSFFQNLFLRNATERRPVVELNKLSSVLELAQMYQRRVNWPETYKSEPSLVTFYLNQKRPVSLSKFRRFDSDFSSSRSHSPLGSLHSENFQLKLRRFDSMSQFGDGLYKDHSPEGKERSSSEPPFFRSGSNSPEEEKCTKTSQSEANSMRSSPNSSRSPSSRRIRSYRSPSKPLEYYRCIKRISSRARSAGDVEKIKSKSNISGELAESTSSLNLSNFSDHAEYSILEFIPTRKCERFRELHKFYSNLERMEKLEKTASTGDLRPRLRNEEIIDFDRWKKVRTKERAEAELKTLVDNLMKTQKEKDLLFRAADVAAIRWKGDRGLRIKERSVEDLKEQFNRYTEKEEEPELMVDSKRTEKYLWKGGSVVDVTGSSTLSSHRYKPLSVGESQRSGKATSKMENECGYTLKAWSSLSNEELRLLKGQLSEIYTQEAHRKRFSDWSESVRDKYDIIVPSNADIKSPGESSLRVQCASTTSRSQTLTPTKERKEILRTEWEHSGSVKTLPLSHEQTGDMELSKFSRSHSETRHSRQEYFPTKRSKSASSKPLSEDEKKRLSLTLSREVIEKMAKGSSTTPVLPRETMGALAVASGKFQKGTTSHPKPVDDFLFVMTSENRNDEFIQDWRGNVDDEISKSTKLNVISELESGSGSSETSIKTVIRNNSLDVLKKVQYFEDLQQGNDETAEGMENVEEFNSLETREYERKKVVDTVDRHTENFRKDKSDVMIEVKKEKSKAALTQSSSLENIDHYFGQQKQYATSPQPNKSAEKFVSTESSRTLIPPPVKTEENVFDEGKWVPVRYDSTSPVAFKRIPSRSGSYESLFSYRSRSVSPDPTKYYRTYLRMVKCGAVRKLCNKFESWEDLLSLSCDKDFWLPPAPRRFASDPELTRDLLKRFGTDPTKVTIRGQEVGDVRWLRTKFEKDLNPVRGRSRFRRVRSPLVRSSLTGPDRFMPRINVISKKAELQLQGLQPEQGKSLTSPTRRQELPASPEGYTSLIDYTKDHGGYYFTGEVEKLKRKFEKLEDAERLSILGQMYTSTPDVNELRDIAPYLECGWVAHRHPGHSTSPEFQAKKREPSRKVNVKPRPRSSSPVRTNKPLSILKQSYPSSDRSVFADQKFDPSIHRPKYRYQPERDVDRRFKSGDSDWWRNWNKPTVTFKEAFDFGFDPDISQICDLSPPDSPRKYVESEVTIHYKSPVRSEAKAMLSEDELARRQAESMKRIYKEERRRKYLQELQDMNSRRHTDNFTPSQKSPIPLNRYDDFPLDCNQYYPKTKDHSIDPVLVARGLYDFVGKRPRDLAFRRGDIIFIMRRLDKNWCEGELNGAVGLFPLSYVEVIPYNEIHMKFGRARAKYDFAPQTPLELSARKGDMVTLIRKIDENWFEGRIGERTGIIPASYCHIMAMPQASRTVSHTEKVSKPVAAPAAHSLIHDGSRVSSKHYYTPYLSSPNSPGRSTASATSTNYSDGHLMTADMLIDEALMQLDEEFDLKRGNSNVPSRNVRVHPRPEPALYQVLFNHVPNNDDELELVQGETVTVVEKCGDGWYIGSKTNDGKLGIFPGTHVRRIAPEFV